MLSNAVASDSINCRESTLSYNRALSSSTEKLASPLMLEMQGVLVRLGCSNEDNGKTYSGCPSDAFENSSMSSEATSLAENIAAPNVATSDLDASRRT